MRKAERRRMKGERRRRKGQKKFMENKLEKRDIPMTACVIENVFKYAHDIQGENDIEKTEEKSLHVKVDNYQLFLLRRILLRDEYLLVTYPFAL